MLSQCLNKTIYSVQRLGLGASALAGQAIGSVLGRAEGGPVRLFSTTASSFAAGDRGDGSLKRGGSQLDQSMDRVSTSAFLRKVELTDLDDREMFPQGRLYHYTTNKGGDAIGESEVLRPSTKEKNARYGAGQYFTNVGPEWVICARIDAKLKGDDGHYSASELAHRFYNHGFTAKVRKAVSVDLRELVKLGKLYKIECPHKQADPRCKAKSVSMFVNLFDRNLELKTLHPKCQVVVEMPKPKPMAGYISIASAKTFADDTLLVRYIIDKKAILVDLRGGELNGDSPKEANAKRDKQAERGLTSVLKKNGLYPPRGNDIGHGVVSINHASRHLAVVRGGVGGHSGAMIDAVVDGIGDLIAEGIFKRIVFVLPKAGEVRSSASNSDNRETADQINSVIKSLKNQKGMLPMELAFRE